MSVFILSKEKLKEWLLDSSYYQKFQKQIFTNILIFYQSYFENISPVGAAIYQVEKDLGVSLDKEKLTKHFYNAAVRRKNNNKKIEGKRSIK
jgi:hypothetical protein